MPVRFARACDIIYMPDEAMEPRRIASYTLLEPIGSGGMAVVYRARQETLDRIVAVKVLSENLATSEEFIERFRRERSGADASDVRLRAPTLHRHGSGAWGRPGPARRLRRCLADLTAGLHGMLGRMPGPEQLRGAGTVRRTAWRRRPA